MRDGGLATAMRRRGRLRPMARLLAAMAAALLGLLALSAAQMLEQPQAADGTSGASIIEAGEAVLAGAGPEEALASQGLAPAAEADVPPWFAEEVMDAEACVGAFANDDWSVVGIMQDGAPEPAFDKVVEGLEARGWTLHESGIENAATLTKEEGEARWMMLQCTAVGDSTSVVLQSSR